MRSGLLRRYDVEAVHGVLRGARWNLPALANPASLPSDDALLAQAAGAAPLKPYPKTYPGQPALGRCPPGAGRRCETPYLEAILT